MFLQSDKIVSTYSLTFGINSSAYPVPIAHITNGTIASSSEQIQIFYLLSSHDTPLAAKLSIGQLSDDPVQLSGRSHIGVTAGLQTKEVPYFTSAGQVEDIPLQTSGASQGPLRLQLKRKHLLRLDMLY